MATKAELESMLAKKDTERPTVSTVIAVPIMVVGVLLTIAVAYLIAQRTAGPDGTLPPVTLAIPALAAWAVAHMAAGRHFLPSEYGPVPATHGRALAALTGPAAAVWLVWTGYVGPSVTWMYLFMGGGVAALLWAALLWDAQRRLRDDPVVVAPNAVDPGMPWPRLVERASGGKARLVAVTPHRAGVKLEVEPGRFLGEDGEEHDEDITFDEFAGYAARFQTLAAIEYRRRTGTRLPLNAARPEEGRDDAEFLMHVTMRDVFGENTKYVPATTPQTIRDPKDLGEYEDGERILITIEGRHAKMVGATGSGKSVEANNWIARITECRDALVWICATDKLIPLIFPWLRSWFEGTAAQPVLDYVAGLNVERCLGMLADAYKLCCDRNARLTDESSHTPTEREPAVVVFVEEMSHMMGFDATITTHDGIECDASTLIMMIARAGRSARVQVVLMSQTALNVDSGDCAAEIIRQLTIRVCLQTLESHDGWRTIPALNNVDTTQIPLHTKIVQPNIEKPRAMPGKAPYLDGTATISEIAVRNAGWRPVGGVEPESDLGQRYRYRWHPQFHPELARAVEKHRLQWRIPNQLVGVDAPGPLNIIAGSVDTPTHPGGGITVPTEEEMDAELREFLTRETGDEGPAARRRAGGFQLPDGDAELARMRELARDLAENPPRVPGDDGPGEEPHPLPVPLDAIIEWLDELDERGEEEDFYLSEAIAAAIDHPDRHAMGRAIWRVAKVRSRTARVEEDRERRRGYDTAALREAAARIRFGL